MKKTIYMIFLLLAVFTASFAVASNETIPNTQNGAQTRLLQLQYALERNIAQGEEVLSRINDSRLEEILDEIKLLAQEVESADLNKTARELAQDFVSFRHTANELTKEFREIARSLIQEERREEIKAQAQERLQNRLDEVHSKIEQARLRHNNEVAKKALEKSRIVDESLQERIRNNTATNNEIREAITSAARNITSEERMRLNEEARALRLQAEEMRRQAVEDAKALRERYQSQVRSNERENVSVSIRGNQDE